LGETKLRLKKWLFLFWTTLLIGALTALLLGFYFEAGELEYTSLYDRLIGAIGYIGAGLMFSVVSQMGFFAYLTVHYFALHLFKAKWVWQTVQVILIGFLFVDTAYLRHLFFAPGEAGMAEYFILPSVLLGYAILIAFWKAKLTNGEAFIPAVFFMFVVTLLEAVPSLTTNKILSIQLMLTTIVICNTWQVLNLHRLVRGKSEESFASKKLDH
jgi:KinB signaling pathway activation protein